MKALRWTLAVASLVAMVWAPASRRTSRNGRSASATSTTPTTRSASASSASRAVAAKSGGKMKVQEFPASTLGNEMQQQSALQGGVQEMSAPATTSLAGIVKEFGLVDFPFAVGNFAQADALLDGPLGQTLIAKLPEKGLRRSATGISAFATSPTASVPITEGRGSRRSEDPRHPEPGLPRHFKAFKANPVPMPFAELYGALESKAVDGQENPFAVILSNKFFEVQKFVSATNHVYAANIMLVSKRFWDKLSPAEQKIMNDAANEARGYQRQVSRAAAQKAVGELQAKGMQFNEVAPAEQARMRQIAKAVTDKFTRDLRPGDRQALHRRARPHPQGLSRRAVRSLAGGGPGTAR